MLIFENHAVSALMIPNLGTSLAAKPPPQNLSPASASLHLSIDLHSKAESSTSMQPFGSHWNIFVPVKLLGTGMQEGKWIWVFTCSQFFRCWAGTGDFYFIYL